jgi:hypothetical protein
MTQITKAAEAFFDRITVMATADIPVDIVDAEAFEAAMLKQGQSVLAYCLETLPGLVASNDMSVADALQVVAQTAKSAASQEVMMHFTAAARRGAILPGQEA